MKWNSGRSCNRLLLRGNNLLTDLNEIQVFVQVSKKQSFTSAAVGLGIPKSTASRAITRLEKRLGVTLIERTTRRVTLTDAGELYLNRCERVLEEAEQAERAVTALMGAPRGVLRVAVPGPFARTMLAPLLAPFLRLYPGIRLQMQLLDAGLTPTVRNLDVEIRPGPLDDSGLYIKPLMQIRLGIYASREYVQEKGVPETPSALAQHHCIATGCGRHGEPRERNTWRLRRGTEVREITVEPRVAVPDPPMGYQLMRAGAGVAMLAQSILAPDVESGRIVHLLPEWEPEPVQLYAVYSGRMESSPKVRALLQFLEERLGKEIPPHVRPRV